MLVVDDSELSRELLRDSLSAFSFRVTTASSGRAGMQAMVDARRSGHPFLLVLMDWRMPEMDGLETVRRLRRHPELTDQPAVIMITAYNHQDLSAGGALQAVEGFITKPASQSALFDSIQEALRAGAGVQDGEGVLGTLQDNRKFFPGTRALLVEDNAINQEIAVELLRDAGVDVRIAADGAKALELLQQETFGALLMDMEMPVMDGFEATQRLRADARFKDLPIIALTAHAMTGDDELFLKVGMTDYISKPVTERKLLKTLARWLPWAPDCDATVRIGTAANGGYPSCPRYLASM